MVATVVLPRLGWDMHEGSLVEWLKHDGDLVQVGEVICTIEGDKAIDELESMDSGILRISPDAPSPGLKVPVGTILGYLVQAGERAPFEVALMATGAAVATSTDRESDVFSTVAPASPPTQWSVRSRGPSISPRARRIASELEVDWSGLSGSGRSGRIVERDVRAAMQPVVLVESETYSGQADAISLPSLPALDGQTVPLSDVRRITARRMAESAHSVAPVTLTTEADATMLARLRDQVKVDLAGSSSLVPSYNDLLAKLVAIALGEHPQLNASLVGDAIARHSTVNVGIAVDTERGLLVPVVRDVGQKSVQQIAVEAARLIERARSGNASADDLRGGTFTITNLGMYEIDAFTPIINLPECAILGVGRIVARPIVVDEAAGTIEIRKMLALSLTIDHRVVDGAPAARFLQRVKYLVEHPMLGLIQ